jgi:hypothetical protein
MPAGARFMDSQPLTGVSAERHFSVFQPITPEWAHENRLKLTQSAPTFVVDSIGLANPHLAIARYPELASWLDDYVPIERTTMSVIYMRYQTRQAFSRTMGWPAEQPNAF